MKKIVLFLIMFFGFLGNIYASDYIIYTNGNDGYKLYRKNANDSGNGTAITSVCILDSRYSPDSNYIIYSGCGNNMKLYRKNANDTSDGVPITTSLASYPSYSPDGEYIIYTNRSDNSKIYKKNANDTSDGTAITSISSFFPSYSPDGEYIIYMNFEDNMKLYRKNANDISDGTAITSVSGVFQSYSPDGNYIIYSNNNDGGKLYRKNASDTSDGIPITSVNGSFTSYSPDGNYIIYSNGNDGGKLYRKNANDISDGIAITSVNGTSPSYSPNSLILSSPTNLKQYIKLPEAPTLGKQEIPVSTKVGKYQSGSGIILSANVNNTTNTQLRLEFEVYRLGASMPSIQLNTNYFLTGTGEVIVPYLLAGQYYWKVRTKDINGATSDWVDYNTNYPWEYDYALFEGFEPYPYGYSFGNNIVESGLLTGGILNYFDTDFPFFHRSKIDGNKWDIFDKTFDTSIFTNNERKKIAAFDSVGLNGENFFMGGSCYGMASSSSMQYKYPNFMNTHFSGFYNQVSNGTVWNNLNSPKTTSSNTWNTYNDVLSTILSFQLSQRSNHVANAKINGISNLNDIILELQNNPQKRYILSFWGTKKVLNQNGQEIDEAVGHAVVPYKVEGDKIYFWDNNYPAPYTIRDQNNHFGYSQYLLVQSNNSFIVPSYQPGWISFDSIKLINLEDIYNGGQKSSPIGFNNNDSFLSLSGSADIVLKDSLGRVSGFLNGQILTGIPGVDVIIPLDETFQENPKERTYKQIYLPQKQNLEIKVIGKLQESYDITIAGGDYFTKIEGVQTSLGELDNYMSTRENFKIDFDNSKIGNYNLLVENFYNNGTGTVYMHSIPSIGKKQTYNIDWTKVINNLSDSVIYKQDLNNDGIYETEQNLPPIYKYTISPLARPGIQSEEDYDNEDK